MPMKMGWRWYGEVILLELLLETRQLSFRFALLYLHKHPRDRRNLVRERGVGIAGQNDQVSSV